MTRALSRNVKSLAPALVALFCVSCATHSTTPKEPEKHEPAKTTLQAQTALKSAEKTSKSDPKKAMVSLRKIAQQNPGTEVEAKAQFDMGNLHFNQGQYQEALNNYNTIIQAPYTSAVAAEAHIRAAHTLVKLGRAGDAEAMLDLAARLPLTPEQSLEAEKIRVEVEASAKKNVAALKALMDLENKSPQAAEKEKYRNLQHEFIETRLSEDELKEVAGDSSFGPLQVQAKYRLGVMLADEKQFSRARQSFGDVVQMAPGTDLASRASGYLQQLDTRNKVDTRTIGVVLPLTGKQAAIGAKALRGIQLGLGIYGKNASNFRLAVVDSEGNPDTARRAIERLVQENNVIGLIGGLLSKTASAEASKAQEYGVPMILLSQKAGVTQAGDFIFRNALTGQMQVRALVELAMTKLGYHSFAIVFPNDAYGTEYANLFWDEVKSRGGEIAGAQPYDPKETDFRGYIQRLVGLFYLEDRYTEYNQRLKAYNEAHPKRSVRAGGPSIEDILPPIVDFDAVFIPDSARAVGQIAPMLAYNNVNGVRLLGTNLWNSPSLISRGQKFVENSVFVDSVLSTDASFKDSDFYKNFKATFPDEEPGLMEVQAYDSALIMRQSVAGGESSRVGLRGKIASLQSFPGAVGLLSVGSDREIHRPMTALTVRAGQIVPLETTAQ